MIPFSAIVTPSSISFTGLNGKNFVITEATANYEEIRATIREVQTAKAAGDEATVLALRETLDTLATPAKLINKAGEGKVTVEDGVVKYAGEPVHGAVTERILWGLREGYDMKPYMLFLDNLMANPSKRAVDELYEFLEKHKMGITDEGYIIAYKKVREDYKDIYSGQFDNSPGQVLEMVRNKVDDDKDRTCSSGFHFCAFAYLPEFGSGPGNRVVIVKVNPADVVSIPSDYNAAKARCCRYEVIGEYEGDDLQDLLSRKAVWSDSDWSYSEGSDDNDEDYYDNEDDSWDDGDEDSWGDEDDSSDADEDYDDPASDALEALSTIQPSSTLPNEAPAGYTVGPDGLLVPVYSSNTSPLVPRVTEIAGDDYKPQPANQFEGRSWGDPPNPLEYLKLRERRDEFGVSVYAHGHLMFTAEDYSTAAEWAQRTYNLTDGALGALYDDYKADLDAYRNGTDDNNDGC